MERLKLLQKFYARLARLEDSREELRIKGDCDEQIALIDTEMKEIRLKVQEVMNSPCPVFKGDC